MSCLPGSVLAVSFILSALVLPADAADEPDAARSLAEWHEIVLKETVAERAAESPQRQRLLLSAGRALHPHRGGPDKLAESKGAQREQYGPFLTWMEREGNAPFRKWRAGEAPPSEARWLLHGVALHRYRGLRRKARKPETLTPAERDMVDYGNRVDRRGRELLRNGYLGGRFTRAEIDELRVYALWLDTRNTGDGVLPFHLGLTTGRIRTPPPLGQEAPDFLLMRMDAALRSPNYSDQNPADPADVLRPASVMLQELLMAMQGYEPDASARPAVRARPIVVPEGKGDDYVRLSSFRGKKAVLLLFANATDTWCWHARLTPMVQPLAEAYGDRIAFFLIHCTIHDAHMPVLDFLDATPARHDAVHDLSMEQRARNCKMFYMNWPHITVPYLLDDMAQRTRNAYRDQGGGAYFVLVDLDGRVAYADYHKDIPPHWGPKAVQFPYEHLTIRMNHLESRLADFVANGCRYAKSIETPYPTWRLKPGVKMRPGADKTIWLAGRVKAIEAQTLVVERNAPDPETMKGWQFWQKAKAEPFDPHAKARLATVAKWVKAGDDVATRTLRFAIDDAIDVFLHGQAIPLVALKPGDCVGVRYLPEQEGQDPIRPIQVRAQRVPPLAEGK